MLAGVHPDLQPRVFGYLVLGLVCSAVGLTALGGALVSPAAPRWALALFTAVMLALSWLLLVHAPAWYRRATWVLWHAPAEPMRLRLRTEASSDSTYLYADLSPAASAAPPPPLDSHWMHWPPWDTAGFGESAVQVYRDPADSALVVVETSRGLLWPYPHGRLVFPRLLRRFRRHT